MGWYPTPDEIPPATTCKQLIIPDDPAIIATVIGALSELAKAYNWDKVGAVDPDAIAERMLGMIAEFVNSECEGEMAYIGEIRWFAQHPDDLPAGWLQCNGVEAYRDEYHELFALIGTTYGAGNGTTTFNLPNLNGRSPMGIGNSFLGGSHLIERGEQLGEFVHMLTAGEIPSHAHGVSDPGHTHPPVSPYTSFLGNRSGGTNTAPASTFLGAAATTGSATTGITVNNTGGGGAHNNVQPSLGLLPAIYAG